MINRIFAVLLSVSLAAGLVCVPSLSAYATETEGIPGQSSETVSGNSLTVPDPLEETGEEADEEEEEKTEEVPEETEDTKEEQEAKDLSTEESPGTDAFAPEEASLETETREVLLGESKAADQEEEPVDGESGDIVLDNGIIIRGFQQESEDLVYTGAKVTQELHLYDGEKELTENKDYTLTYKNNINAKAYNTLTSPSVTITMRKQYSGSITLYYTILPVDLTVENEDNSLSSEQVVVYGKEVKIPDPVMVVNNRQLVAGRDFTCDYSTLPQPYNKGDSYTDGQVYTYQVQGTGNYTGSVTMSLAVVRDKNKDFSSGTITLDSHYYLYQGKPLTGSDIGVTFRLGGKELENSLYYTVVTAPGAGVGVLEIFPTEEARSQGYRGTAMVRFAIIGDRNIQDVVTGEGWQESLVYSQRTVDRDGGMLQNKTGVLYYGEGESREVLTEGTDYTVRYLKNTAVGTATAVFIGKGRYTGTWKLTYEIVPNTELKVIWTNSTDNSADTPTAAYSKGGAVPEFTLNEVYIDDNKETYYPIDKTNYSYVLKNNQTVGETMTCVITGKGNYQGYSSGVISIEVTRGDLSKGSLTVEDKRYTQTGSWVSPATVKDASGRKLMAGVDYELSYSVEDREPAGENEEAQSGAEDENTEDEAPGPGAVITVKAVGINNYCGELETAYHLYTAGIASLTVVIDEKEYTGQPIELTDKDIHVYATEEDAKAGREITEKCYEIVGYGNHTDVGLGKVTLRGVGDYGGTKSYTFRIKKKGYDVARVTGITLNASSLTLGLGSSYQMSAVCTPEDAVNKTIIWTTSDSSIAAVSDTGLVTAKKTGKVTIQAISQDTGVKASCSIKIEVKQVVSFSLNTTEITGKVGEQHRLEAVDLNPADATYSTIQWESTNPKVASVDSSGMITMNNAGTTVVIAYGNNRKFTARCLVKVSSIEEEPLPEGMSGNYVTVTDYRKVNENDDTKAFWHAIDALEASNDKNTLYVPEGEYLINAVYFQNSGVDLISGMTLEMSPNAVIRVVGNKSQNYGVFRLKNLTDVTISGGQIIGERYSHTGTGGEWGMGIKLVDCTNVTISNVKVSNCWGDGIYLGSDYEADSSRGCKNITIENCTLENNRRNNLSIVCADDVTVNNSRFNKANGTDPQYGIDIEPNVSNNPCERITISNSTFSGNAVAAMGIVTVANDVVLEGCTLNGDFINYTGTNVTLKDTTVYGSADCRYGIIMEGSSTINGGSKTEDLLIAELKPASQTYSLGGYNINSNNQMSANFTSSSYSSGRVLRLQRSSQGNLESGYYINLRDFSSSRILENGATYRFEYVVRGSGQWGIRTSQTGWYPCVPQSDKFTTGMVTYKAGSSSSCQLYLYAVDKTNGMYLEIESVKIYKVR